MCVAMLAAAVIAVVRILSTDDCRKGGLVSPSSSGKGAIAEPSASHAARPPLPGAGPKPSQRPYDGSNVFIRLPSGAVVRQGESIPPLAEEDKGEVELRSAAVEWERLVKVCAGGTRANGRKVGYAEFAKALRRFPKEKRSENLRYAINAMDESNFLLIATLALDRNQPDEIVAEAFDACLNRDCAASRAAIEAISEDKTHPMYVDAARVMDIKRLAEGTLPGTPNSAK